MSYELRSIARTHTGMVRDHNEDSSFTGPRILLVADGMGGHAAGEVASSITAETFAHLDASTDVDDLTVPLTEAINASTAEIASRIEGDPALRGMGTTVTAILFGAHRAVVANVGDSRAYLYQRSSGEFAQLTQDDSYVQMMVDTGEITAEEALHHPYRNVVMKAVNGEAVTPRFTTLEILPGDRFLLCSDGLTDYVDLHDIGEAIRIADIAAAADRMISLALDAGAPDNVTVVLGDLVPARDPNQSPIDAPATRPITLWKGANSASADLPAEAASPESV